MQLGDGAVDGDQLRTASATVVQLGTLLAAPYVCTAGPGPPQCRYRESEGRFELLSARTSCWFAWQHLEVKMSSVSLEKHAFRLPVEPTRK
eukprot:4729707-Prymnesium_polylepis.2